MEKVPRFPVTVQGSHRLMEWAHFISHKPAPSFSSTTSARACDASAHRKRTDKSFPRRILPNSDQRRLRRRSKRPLPAPETNNCRGGARRARERKLPSGHGLSCKKNAAAGGKRDETIFRGAQLRSRAASRAVGRDEPARGHAAAPDAG